MKKSWFSKKFRAHGRANFQFKKNYCFKQGSQLRSILIKCKIWNSYFSRNGPRFDPLREDFKEKMEIRVNSPTVFLFHGNGRLKQFVQLNYKIF